jgi:PKD repeat protein
MIAGFSLLMVILAAADLYRRGGFSCGSGGSATRAQPEQDAEENICGLKVILKSAAKGEEEMGVAVDGAGDGSALQQLWGAGERTRRWLQSMETSKWLAAPRGSSPSRGDAPSRGKLWARPNRAPEAGFTFTPSSPRAVAGVVHLDASASSDADGDSLSYAWDVDGDGETDFEGASPSAHFSEAGETPVTLTVTDEHGNASELTKTISVRGPRPGASYAARSLDYARDVFVSEGNPYVKKWTRDLVVSVNGHPTQRSREALRRALRIAASYAGIGVTYVEPGSPEANVRVIYMSRAEVEKRFGQNVAGQTQTQWQLGGSSITEGTVYLSYAKGFGQSEANGTTYHEVGHLFGLDHAEGGSPSIMTPSSHGKETYAEVDLRGLEMLYQPEVKHGMRIGEVVEVLRSTGRPFKIR